MGISRSKAHKGHRKELIGSLEELIGQGARKCSGPDGDPEHKTTVGYGWP